MNTSLSRSAAITEIVISAIFLVFTAVFVGLRTEHVVGVVVFSLLYFASSKLRKLAVAMLPFIIFGISYDWMRIVPNYTVNPIDTRPLYEAELALFGITSNGSAMILGEFFNVHNWPLVDVLAGIFYLCWVPLPIAFGLWLYFSGRKEYYLRFAIAFLFVNLLGFAIYYVHPAAPPWYVINYGFEPITSTPGNVAGLIRFEQITGWSVFQGLYSKNANIFAAVPSLHAAYMLIAFVYALISKQHKAVLISFAIVTIGIWFTAVYTCHHYVIDVLLGICCALVGILLFEKVILKTGPFRRFVDRYLTFIS